MRSPFFGNMEQAQLPGHFDLQNPRMLRVHLNGDVLARQGSMVAFQGQMDFDYEGSGSVGRFLKKALTGEGVPTMRVRGQGLLFLAHNADDIHLFGRIAAIADCFDAMTTNRTYQPAITAYEVLHRMLGPLAPRFDQHLLEVFIRLLRAPEVASSFRRQADDDAARLSHLVA